MREIQLNTSWLPQRAQAQKLRSMEDPSLEIGASVVLGGQWGDEGKGKLVDILGQRADVVARCQVRESMKKKIHTLAIAK